MSTELAEALRTARKAGNVTQVAVTAATGISQARLSRIENGRALPSEDEVDNLAMLYSTPADVTRRLVTLVRESQADLKDSRLVIQRGSTLASQQRWRAMEHEAAVVRSFQPALVVGSLQIPAYAATAMRVQLDSDAVRDRMRRQERLGQDGRRLVVLQTEGALRRTVGSAAVMAEQMKFLIEVSRIPTVELGVIPDSSAADFVVGTGFHVYDDLAAVVGVEVASALLTDPNDVSAFSALFIRLSDLAIFADDAQDLLRRLADEYDGLLRRAADRNRA